MTGPITDEWLRDIHMHTVTFDTVRAIAAELLAHRNTINMAEGEAEHALDGEWFSDLCDAIRLLRTRRDEASSEMQQLRAERDEARAEVERLRDEAAKWHNLLPVYEDAEREVQQLRADLREALSLLRSVDLENWSKRYDALLEKHKETNQ